MASNNFEVNFGGLFDLNLFTGNVVNAGNLIVEWCEGTNYSENTVVYTITSGVVQLWLRDSDTADSDVSPVLATSGWTMVSTGGAMISALSQVGDVTYLASAGHTGDLTSSEYFVLRDQNGLTISTATYSRFDSETIRYIGGNTQIDFANTRSFPLRFDSDTTGTNPSFGDLLPGESVIFFNDVFDNPSTENVAGPFTVVAIDSEGGNQGTGFLTVQGEIPQGFFRLQTDNSGQPTRSGLSSSDVYVIPRVNTVVTPTEGEVLVWDSDTNMWLNLSLIHI